VLTAGSLVRGAYACLGIVQGGMLPLLLPLLLPLSAGGTSDGSSSIGDIRFVLAPPDARSIMPPWMRQSA
jgi:hypothetical protein